jgi:DNA-binding SARP family transcriptional activator/tetratricopeptide (TPR) repeat protein
VECRLLGPVEILDGAAIIDLGPPQRRLVFAALAVDIGRTVPTETLVDRVWDEAPPTARRALQVHLSHLRAILHGAAHGQNGIRIAQRSGGYLLDGAPDRVDVHAFGDCVARADRAGAAERTDLLRRGLRLWRGEPLAGLPGCWAAETRQYWHEQRIAAALMLAQAALDRSRPETALEDLTRLTARYTLVEPLTAALVRLLHLAGRAPEALARYEEMRHRLAHELGLDPGAELRAAHLSVLRGDEPIVVRPDADATVPRQTPGDVFAFVGRRHEIERLNAIVAGSDGVPIAVLSGAAGVGKTALAVHWVHRVLDRFPDGQLWVDLGGFRAGGTTTPAEALTAVLCALGDGPGGLPTDPGELSARYRSAVAGRRLLIVLDNAASAAQVRPLLPGSPSCLAVVISRDRLAALVARDGARRIDVDPLPTADAMGLLRELIGPRVDAEPEAAAALAQRCARLPLALRVAAEVASARPGRSLRVLADQLHDERRSLDVLDADGDAQTGVRAVFAWSYRALPCRASAVFRLLGVHPGRDYEAYAVAALSGLALAEARDALTTLADAHLVERVGDDRYAMHDLLRAYAAERADAEPAAGTDAARARLIGMYVETTAAAMELLYPAERHLRPQRSSAPVAGDAPFPPLGDADAAGRWLEAERGNLVAVCMGPPDSAGETGRLGGIIGRHLADNGYPSDALAVHRRAFEVTTATGDRLGAGTASMNLGAVYWNLGDNAAAAEHFERALAVFEDLGDRRGQARALNNLAVAYSRLGRYEEGIDRILRVLRIARALDDRIGAARALNNLGTVRVELGQYAVAADDFARALTLCEDSGDSTGEALAHGNLGDVHFHRGAYRDALVHYGRTRDLFGHSGQRSGAARAGIDIANVYDRQGRHADAEALRRAALEVFRDVRDDDGEALALLGIGESHLALRDHRAAIEYATDALDRFRRLGNRRGEVLARVLLGAAEAGGGDPGAAVAHFERACADVTAAGMGGPAPAVHNGLGAALRLLGRGDEALAHHGWVLHSPTTTDDRYERSRAHAGIAEVHDARDAPAEAREHWLRALAGYDGLGVPEAEAIRRRLGTVRASTGS